MSAHAEGIDWGEVQLSNLIEENRQLKVAASERDRDDLLALALWEGVVRELTEQRDRARATAARLEAELAIVEEAVEVVTDEVAVASQCTSWAKHGLSQIRCQEDVHGDDVQHRWGDLTW